MIKEINHQELVEIGYKWCMKRCGFAFKEIVTAAVTGEIPDIIGFNSVGTFLLEAKVSRADFFKDKNKMFRATPCFGMGDWRFYITPKDMIAIEELPDMWGLIEVNEKGKARVKHNPFGKGNIYSSWKRCEKHNGAEYRVLYSALRRVEVRGKLQDNIKPIKHGPKKQQ